MMRAAVNQTPDKPVLLRDLLTRISAQLRDAATAIERLEETISDLAFAQDGRMSQHAINLQSADLIRQQIDGLAEFINLLAPSVEEGITVDIGHACAALKLGALIDRLLANGDDVQTSQAHSDDFELFHLEPYTPTLRWSGS
jgi:hypothetical protein